MYWIFFLSMAGRLIDSIVEVVVLTVPELEYDDIDVIPFPECDIPR